MPSMNDVHINKPLTNYSRAYRPPNVVFDQIATDVKVEKEVDIYWIHGKDAFVLEDDIRTIRSKSNEIDFGITTGVYQCVAHALKGVVSERELRNQDPQVDIMAVQAANTKSKVRLNKEVRGVNMVKNGFTKATNSKTFVATEYWNDYDGALSDPFKHIEDAKSAVRLATGVDPTHMFASPDVLSAFSQHPDYIERVKYTNGDLASKSGIPKYICGLEVVSADSVTCADANSDFEYVWSDMVFIPYVNKNASLNCLNAITNFYTQPGVVRKWYDIDRNSYIIEYEEINVEVIVNEDAGYCMKNVLNYAG